MGECFWREREKKKKNRRKGAENQNASLFIFGAQVTQVPDP